MDQGDQADSTDTGDIGIPYALLRVWEAALPQDAPGAWIRAAIERQAREAVADSLREADL